MTSKKRDDFPPAEGENDPKRPRGGGGDEAKQEEESRPPRQGRRDWLSYSGRRQPRIGEEFQATALPKVASNNNDPEEEAGTTVSNDNSKEEEERAAEEEEPVAEPQATSS